MDKYVNCGWYIMEKRDHSRCHLLITKEMGSLTFSDTMTRNASMIIWVDVIVDGFMIVICTHIVGYGKTMISL